jgi:hypothetical protein
MLRGLHERIRKITPDKILIIKHHVLWIAIIVPEQLGCVADMLIMTIEGHHVWQRVPSMVLI